MAWTGLSEEPVQQEMEAVGSGGGATWEAVAAAGGRRKQRRKKCQRKVMDVDLDDNEGAEDDENGNIGGGSERQREHPFIVTEPGEVARGKKNGLDYLFHLYEQCRDFLIQVQNIAKERGEKCPTKVHTTHTLQSSNSLFYCTLHPDHYATVHLLDGSDTTLAPS